MKKIVSLFICMFIFNLAFAEVFSVPIFNSYLTASFGEFRATGGKPHFHLGVDFSTFGRNGEKVYASASGYIEKIWVNDEVYGNTIFVKHPNNKGLLTVYAHLQDYNEQIKKYSNLAVKEFGANKKIEIIFPEEKMKVLRNQEIALSGSSGQAEKPHLHFEVREEQVELVNGEKKVSEYALDPLDYLEYNEVRKKEFNLKGVYSGNRLYTLPSGGTLNIPFFGSYPEIIINPVEKVEKQTLLPKNITLKLDNNPVYQLAFSKISLNDAYNPFPVYMENSTSSEYIIKLYSNVPLSPIKNNTLQTISGKRNYAGELILEDRWGNKSSYFINFYRN